MSQGLTQAQRTRIFGIRATQRLRGVSVTLNPSGPNYNALYNKIPPSGDPNQISKETRNMSVICILKEDIGEQAIVPGNSFSSRDGTTFRIVKVENEEIDVLTRFTCEES